MNDRRPQQRDRDLDRYARMMSEARQLRGVSLGRDAWRRLRRDRTARAALVILAVVCLLALLTPLLPLQSPRRVHTDRPFTAPRVAGLFSARIEVLNDAGAIDPPRVDAEFGKLNALDDGLLRLRVALFGERALTSLCGTDELGRDLLARIFWGARVSLIVGLVATLVSLVIGVSYGAVSGYLGGWVDNLMMRVVDVLYSIPFIFVVIFPIMVLSEESVATQLRAAGIDRITIFFFVVGAIYWLTMARVVRGQVISLKNEQYVEAARAIGAGRVRVRV